MREGLVARFGDKALFDEPLANHTTFGVGGPADVFIKVLSDSDMVDAVNMCVAEGADYFILGGGSNILASDAGYRGVIIKSELKQFSQDGRNILVGSGFDWEDFVDRVCDHGLAGIEMLAGIKGTVGGAIYGNAGAYGGAVSDHLISAKICKPGEQPREVTKNYFAFKYRDSILKRTKEVVLSAMFRFDEGDASALQSRKNEILELRAKRHPSTDCSAGCFFKNIEKADEKYGKLSAGELLDKVNAKEMSVGNAGVYSGHANILINVGGAKAEDIKRLAMILKERVKNEFGHNLEEEITYLGHFD